MEDDFSTVFAYSDMRGYELTTEIMKMQMDDVEIVQDEPEFVPEKVTPHLEVTEEDLEICALIENDLANWWAKFWPQHLGNQQKFFISGGIIANLYHYHADKKKYGAAGYGNYKWWTAKTGKYKTSRYKGPYEMTDIDLYVLVENKHKLKDDVIGLLRHYKSKLVNSKEPGYEKILHGVSKRAYIMSIEDIGLVPTVQIIHCVQGLEPKEITSTFDYHHIKPFYVPLDKRLYITKNQLFLIKNKFLVENTEALEERKRRGLPQHKAANRKTKWQGRGYTSKTLELINKEIKAQYNGKRIVSKDFFKS